MSKKRRNKKYHGDDATITAPQVHRYTAVKRSAWQEKWPARKRLVQALAVLTVVVLTIYWLVSSLLRWIF